MIFASRLSGKYLLFFGLVFCVQMFAMQKTLVDSVEQQRKQDKENIELPLDVLQLRQQIVLLSDNQADGGHSLTFDLLEEPCITHYQLGGKSIARLLQIGDSFHFQDNDIERCNFLLGNELRAGPLAIVTKGKFTFQKPVEIYSASLTGDSVEFLDKFASKQGISIDVSYCDNFGEISCKEILFKGDQFNIMTDGALTAHKIAALLLKKGFFNDGNVSCAEKAVIMAPSFKNYGSLSFENVSFESKKFLNTGVIDIHDSLRGSCKSWVDRGRLNVQNDCIFEQIGTLSMSESAKWNVEKCWKAYIKHFHLDGKVSVGMLALLKIGFHARFDGSLQAPIIHIDSNNFITCNSTARLVAGHHIGLDAKGWLEFNGDIFKYFLQENEKLEYAQKLGTLLDIFPRGIFITSEQGGMNKTGRISARSGIVFLDVKKDLMHAGETGAREALVINAASFKENKNSNLDAPHIYFNDQSSVVQVNKVCNQQQPTIKIKDNGHASKTKTLRFNKANASVSSSIDKPICDKGENPFSAVPGEIWQKIFSVFDKLSVMDLWSSEEESVAKQWESMKDLKHVALTCKWFNYVVHPMLKTCVKELQSKIDYLGGKNFLAWEAFMHSGPSYPKYWGELKDMCLAMKVNLNSVDNVPVKMSGQTLLTQAIQYKDTYQIKALLKAGADAKMPNQHGDMPIDLACRAGLMNEAYLIKRYGGDPYNKYKCINDNLICKKECFGYAYGGLPCIKHVVINNARPLPNNSVPQIPISVPANNRSSHTNISSLPNNHAPQAAIPVQVNNIPSFANVPFPQNNTVPQGIPAQANNTSPYANVPLQKLYVSSRWNMGYAAIFAAGLIVGATAYWYKNRFSKSATNKENDVNLEKEDDNLDANAESGVECHDSVEAVPEIDGSVKELVS